ncbi:MAG: DNA mismatch repair endonuclease MutL [Armatimonadota bacterium]|nr:DNA mismatch repair endonuclease MutL [Armatimonadota bacterium]
MSRIRILDPAVADRIAAGEVVERPASVVKELLENALDAHARSVVIEVEGAGLQLIRVTDDGEGIAEEDVTVAFERFATSKIATLDDLHRMRSYGFRGEALPSIAAVAQVVLTTRQPGAPAAVRVVVVGGRVQSVEGYGAPPGTTVEVRRLFHTTPARLKFLKSPAREQALIADTVLKATLAAPEVTFRLAFDGREPTVWPAASLAERVAAALGVRSPGELIEVHAAVPGGTVRGWVHHPQRSRPTRSAQYVLVNGRPVQHAGLRRAVEQGCAQLVPTGRFPAFVLFLDVTPALVDVNVHPRKLEVRLRDEGRLVGAVAGAVRSALLASPLVRQATAAPLPAGSGGVVTSWQELSTQPAPGSTASLDLAVREGVDAYLGTGGPRLPPLRPLGQVLLTYIVAEGPDGLYLVDQHAAHERVLFERLRGARARGDLPRQVLAVPLPVEVSPADLHLITGARDVLAALGYEVEPFGPHTALLRAVPALAAAARYEDLLRRVLAALADDGEGEEPLDRLAIATACHAAIRAGDRLTPDTMGALLADLATTDDPFTCFHGRPTIVAIPRAQLERWFLRT